MPKACWWQWLSSVNKQKKTEIQWTTCEAKRYFHNALAFPTPLVSSRNPWERLGTFLGWADYNHPKVTCGTGTFSSHSVSFGGAVWSLLVFGWSVCFSSFSLPSPTQLSYATQKLEHLGLTWKDALAAGSFQNMTPVKTRTKCSSCTRVWRLRWPPLWVQPHESTRPFGVPLLALLFISWVTSSKLIVTQ